ncbi:ABC transporter C family member 8-like isoform X2 [Papaver somniferum]|uniref:ABC transporter C family member 8-like isoform X2 n=1 Tax=Papaver somniferum TaxID=3469 RepID=UPI000E6F93E2|nr:ABC transporter C family member 8-like isoform X2 [Papaver somniferum]
MENNQAEFSWICGGEFSWGSSCTHAAIIDGLNLLFIISLSLLWIIGYFRKQIIRGNNTRTDWLLVVVSVCCAVNAIAHFSVSLWGALQKDPLIDFSWAVYLFRGLIWIFVSLSLIVPLIKWASVLILVWWISFSLLNSIQYVETLVKNEKIRILDLVSWFVNLLLLFCALGHYRRLLVSKYNQDEALSEPLLTAKGETNRSGLGNANLFSKLTFSWLNSFMSRGHIKPLVLEDIPNLVPEDEAFTAYQAFFHAWELLRSQKSSENNSNLVLRALAKVYFKEMILVGIFAFLRTLSVVVSPLLLYGFVNYSTRKDESSSHGISLVGLLVTIKVVESLCQRQFHFNSRRFGMRMRSALMVAVYQKQLKLSSLGRKNHSTGEIVNYIAVDAYRMCEFPFWFHSVWTYSVQLPLAVGLLFGVVGLGALPGLVPLLTCAVLNVPFAKMLQTCQTQFMVAQDERIRATSEVLNNMKIIKLQSWEDNFKNLVESLRDREFKWLSKSQLLKSYGTALYWMSPTLISSVVFLGCVFLKSASLNASTIFTILATLRTMSEPVRMIPEALSAIIQVKVSLDRLNRFLLDDELTNENIVKKNQQQNCGFDILIKSGVFSWELDLAVPTLRRVDFAVKRGQKIAVCGPVGAGKSSFLSAILGEVPKISGSVDVLGSIAYVSQISWIQSGTIRDNILFGQPMDKGRYIKAIKSCALDKDIENFNHGDLTEIGQRGLNMSGGQKQRIQLARAVYNDADIYLLDDPFSAVDAHTASTLFNDCVMAALEKKTVILVTHQVEFLSEVDRILVMEGGKMTQSGTYEELLTVGTAFEQLVSAHKNSMAEIDPAKCGNKDELEKLESNMSEESKYSLVIKDNNDDEISMPGIQLTEEEERESGDVGWKPFYDYIIVSKGLLFLGLSTLSQILFVCFQVASTYWLAISVNVPSVNNSMLVGVYAGISALSTFFVYLRTYFAARLGLKASKSFFYGLTNSVFKAPMLFFDSTPIGRILTRVSSDLSVLDFDIPFSISLVIAPFVEIIATICIMALVTWPVLIVAVLTMAAVKYVQASARELIRINGTTKAPVMNYAAETSLGVVTVRAFSLTGRFFDSYQKLIDTDAKLFFHSNAAMEWLVVRVEALQNLTLFTAALLLVLLPQGTVNPGFVGLSLSYALALTGTQVFLARWYCNFSNYIISVERIKQFMHIPSEPPAIVDDQRPPPSWPSNGRIDLENLKIKYRPNSPLVIKGVTCAFKEGTRVGVVGRTGSGKTTLISALFRLVEPTSGKILIDGIDICSMGLKDLRVKLSIIPQEATLFRGTVRTNLDPLGLYTDEEIWNALEKCQLKATISGLPNHLDASVSDDGDNWSAGQRQLFCLGRVLLKRNKILVLDEATASIDSATDAILQRVIRQEFKNCTVITIAHRVPTVTDSDMVMVLSYGNLIEYDEPSKLMGSDSYFSKLVNEYWSSCRSNSLQSFKHYQ